MDLATGIRLAVRMLARHKVRSALSMLGICIGVGAFICSVAIGRGASSQIDEQVRNLSPDLIQVEAGARNVNGVRSGTYGTTSLTLKDAQAIELQIPLVKYVSPNVDKRVQVVHGRQNWSTRVRGVWPEYLAIQRWGVARGSGFSAADVAHIAKVCLLGQTVATTLFGEEDPVGRTVRVQTLPCRVVGVLDVKGASPTGFDRDDVVIMPFTTVQKMILGIWWVDDIFCSALTPEDVPDAEKEITSLMRERHRILAGHDDDFNLRHYSEIAKARAEAQHTMTLLMGCIAAVALVVAGIGIMNIMLVSVAERTREIGIRLAVGARGRDILVQFLLEAVTLSTIGGAIGVGLGIAGSFGIAFASGWPVPIQPDAIVVGFGFAGAVGIIFGLYPARRAYLLDPIEALRRY
jgi:putative ABC transport system permease protein